MPVGDEHSTRAAKALALPTRSAILGHLLKSGPVTAKEVADDFSLHANVARAHLDLLVEAGFLATGIRRQGKGRPSKVYFTWEGEMGTPEDWEVSPPSIPQAEQLPHAAEQPIPAPNPYRLIAQILVGMFDRLESTRVYELAEQVARNEGRKLMLSYRSGGLDFIAAARAMVEELRRTAPGIRIVRMDHDEVEIETPDCPFREIALEHSDLVAIIDPALKEGAMEALGHPSEIETEASVARGDAVCREVVRRRNETSSARETAK